MVHVNQAELTIKLKNQEAYWLVQSIFSQVSHHPGKYPSQEILLRKLCSIFEFSYYEEFLQVKKQRELKWRIQNDDKEATNQ